MSAKTANRRSHSVLGLPEETSAAGFESGLVPYAPPDKPATRDERKIGVEYGKQTLVIEAQAAKTIFAQTKIADINRHVAVVFDVTAGFIVETKEIARGQEHQAYVDEFANRQIQIFARHMLGTVEVGVTRIGLEIDRPLYITAPPRTFWQHVFNVDP